MTGEVGADSAFVCEVCAESAFVREVCAESDFVCEVCAESAFRRHFLSKPPQRQGEQRQGEQREQERQHLPLLSCLHASGPAGLR